MTDQELLDAIDAAIAGSASGGGVLEYEWNGRRVRHMSLTELLQARGILAARVGRANAGGMFRVGRPLRPSGD